MLSVPASFGSKCRASRDHISSTSASSDKEYLPDLFKDKFYVWSGVYGLEGGTCR